MRVKVSLTNDTCLPLPASITMHGGPCFELPTPMMWPPGFVLQQNRLTTTVFHQSRFIVLGDHDCGHMIPHMAIPASPMSVIYTTFSRRKMMFSSSKVKANGAPIGCSEIFGPHAPLPMLCCGSPVALPIGFPVLSWLNTVSVGLSQGDIVAGVVGYAANILGKLLGCLSFFKGGYGGLVRELVGAANIKEWALKNILSSLAGMAKFALTDDGKWARVDLGSGYAGMALSWKTSPEDRLKAERQYQVARGQLGLTHTDKRDGTTSDQSTFSVGSMTGSWGMPL
jgi:hypothetical protein